MNRDADIHSEPESSRVEETRPCLLTANPRTVVIIGESKSHSPGPVVNT